MEAAELRTRAIRQLIVTVAIVALLAVVGAILMSLNPSFEPWWFIGFAALLLVLVTSSLWIIAISYPVFALGAVDRRAALEASRPRAAIAHLVVTPALARQLRAVSVALGMPRSKLRASTYATMVAEADTIAIYSGRTAPVAKVSLPRAALRGAAVSYLAQRKQIPTVTLTFQDASGDFHQIVIVPMYWPSIRPKQLPDVHVHALVSQINAIQTA